MYWVHTKHFLGDGHYYKAAYLHFYKQTVNNELEQNNSPSLKVKGCLTWEFGEFSKAGLVFYKASMEVRCDGLQACIKWNFTVSLAVHLVTRGSCFRYFKCRYLLQWIEELSPLHCSRLGPKKEVHR